MNTTMLKQSIHCKISFNGQIRRFALDSTEFNSMKETITRLLSLNEEFVLKYRDDESDYVTLDSQDDLKTALMLSPKLLRILVDKKTTPMMIDNGNHCDGMSKKYRKRHHHYERHQPQGHHGYHHGPKGYHHGPHHDFNGHHGPQHDFKGHHGPHHDFNGHHGPQHEFKEHHDKSTDRKERREKKLAFINQLLADIGSDDSQLTPRTLFKKQKLIRKKQRIESCQRGDCYNQRKRQGLLTPEDEQQNRSLKVQILVVKTDLAKLKTRQREIKMMLQDKVCDEQLLEELAALKEQKKILKAQKNSLVDQLHI